MHTTHSLRRHIHLYLQCILTIVVHNRLCSGYKITLVTVHFSCLLRVRYRMGIAPVRRCYTMLLYSTDYSMLIPTHIHVKFWWRFIRRYDQFLHLSALCAWSPSFVLHAVRVSFGFGPCVRYAHHAPLFLLRSCSCWSIYFLKFPTASFCPPLPFVDIGRYGSLLFFLFIPSWYVFADVFIRVHVERHLHARFRFGYSIYILMFSTYFTQASLMLITSPARSEPLSTTS